LKETRGEIFLNKVNSMNISVAKVVIHAFGLYFAYAIIETKQQNIRLVSFIHTFESRVIFR